MACLLWDGNVLIMHCACILECYYCKAWIYLLSLLSGSCCSTAGPLQCMQLEKARGGKLTSGERQSTVGNLHHATFFPTLLTTLANEIQYNHAYVNQCLVFSKPDVMGCLPLHHAITMLLIVVTRMYY